MELTDVTFGYLPGRRVLDGFSWTVPKGATLLLGPNGAGKSTMMRLMASSLRASSGTISRDSLVLSRSTVKSWRRAIGWVPQRSAGMTGLTVEDFVQYSGWLRGMSRQEAQAATPDALDRVGLTELAHRPSRSLSGGETRRMSIASALVNRPPMLILDEPTAGLDPAQRRSFRQLVGDLVDTVDLLISTHQTEDLRLMADNVAVLHHGKLAFTGDATTFLSHASEASEEAERAQDAYESIIIRANLKSNA